ncbi:MAG: OmpH family outer membrane protein [Pseudomonadota bacterium]
MRNAILVALTAVLMLAAGARAAEVKIGVVSVQRVLNESAVGSRAIKKIEREFSGRDQEIQKLIKQARDVQTQLERDAVTLSETERQKRERELASLNREVQRAQREFREDLNLRRNEETALLFQKIDKIIKQIAEAEKFDLILQREQIVYGSPAIDITERVMKTLDAETK